MRKDHGIIRRDTVMDNGNMGAAPMQPSSSLKRLFATKSIKQKEDSFKDVQVNVQPSRFAKNSSVVNLVRTGSIASEMSFDETMAKNRVYDFRSLTANKLGNMFSRGHSSSNANSHLISTTASGGAVNSNDQGKSAARLEEGGKLFFGRLSLHETKNFKPRTVGPSFHQTPEIEILRPSSNNKLDQTPQGSSLAISNSENKEVYGNFLQRLNFTSLMEGGERILKEISKTIVVNGKSTTVCCITWENGSTYEGEIVGMKFNGYGLLNHYSGYMVKGSFVDGRINGQGEFTKGRMSYVGNWVNNLPNGSGIEKVDGAYQYEGNFVEGIKHGKGKMKIQHKGKYEGDFKHNMFHGIGTFTWLDGKRYTGHWSQNLMQGRGVMIWPDGRKFEGRYAHNKKEGPGLFTWADGRTCYGMWKDGKQQGNGKYTTLTGEKGHKIWKDGVHEEQSHSSLDSGK